MTDETTAEGCPASAPPALDVAAIDRRLDRHRVCTTSDCETAVLLRAYTRQARELEAEREVAKQIREELTEVIAEFGQFKRETSNQRSDFYNRLEATRREADDLRQAIDEHVARCPLTQASAAALAGEQGQLTTDPPEEWEEHVDGGVHR